MKDLPCSWVGRIHIKKLILLLKLVYRFNVKPIKISIVYFICLEKQARNSFRTMGDQGQPSTPKRKERSWRYHSRQSQFPLQSCSDKDSLALAQTSQANEAEQRAWKGTDKAVPTSFLTNVEEHTVIKRQLFNKRCWQKCPSTCMKLDTYLYLYRNQRH